MKKIIALLLLVGLVIGGIYVYKNYFAGGIPAGTYLDEYGTEVEVSGNKIIMKEDIGDGEALLIKVSYEIKDDEIFLTLEDVTYDGSNEEISSNLDLIKEEFESEINDSASFEKGEDWFSIGGVMYIKQ